MAFPPFLMKQLYRCDSVVIASFVGTGYTARGWGWLLGRRRPTGPIVRETQKLHRN